MNLLRTHLAAYAAGAAADDPRRDIRIGARSSSSSSSSCSAGRRSRPSMPRVQAQGMIAVSGNRQSVQHREGGVVTAIHVREGQRVKAGDVLVEMAAPDLRAQERALTSDYLTHLAQRARLMAERAGQRDFAPRPSSPAFPAEDRALAAQAMALQRAQLQARLASVSAQQSVLGQRSSQLGEQQAGYAQQIALATGAAALDCRRRSTA